jgi:N-methylhydantoinase A
VAEIETECSLDLRYRGQSSTLQVSWLGIEQSSALFEERHEQRYGHRMAVELELVNLRVALRGAATEFTLAATTRADEAAPIQMATLYGIQGGVPVYARDQLGMGQRIKGPALITETVATTWIAPGWECRVDAVGNLRLSR